MSPGTDRGGAATPQGDADFLDRVEEYEHLEHHLVLLAADPGHVVVVGLAGLGGIGKTRFLGEVRSRFAAMVPPPTVVSVALDAPTLPTLLAVREQVPVDCHLFDVAVESYATATELPLPEGERRLSWWSGRLPNGPLPVTFAVDLLGGLDRDVVLRRGYTRSAFAEVDALRSRPDELYQRLPGLLSGDVRWLLTDPDLRRLVFLYDGYEEPRGEPGPSGWLPEFVRSLGAGIHVVTTHAPLVGGGWGSRVEPRILGELPDRECRRMIRRELGDHLRRPVEDRLVSASGRSPFYLHVAIDVCRAYLRQHGSVDVTDLPASSPGMVERLLQHLSPPARTLALGLAAVQYFDAASYDELVKVLDLTDRPVELSAFLEWFFVRETERGLFRTHDLLTDFVRRGAAMADVARRAVHGATEHLARRAVARQASGYEHLPRLFATLVEAWQEVGGIDGRSIERLVDTGYALYDAGHWRELSDLPGLARPAEDPAVVVGQFFSALTSRRSHGPDVALGRLEPLASRAGALGRHAASYDIEVAYLREIRGDYADARERFRELNAGLYEFDPTRRDHLRARLYHADMLTMDGRLREASRLLREAYEALGATGSLDWAELVRHRGHAHRFALDRERAEYEYLQALDAASGARSMQGKLRTNLAETRCWTNPARGVVDAREAIELNSRLGSTIEIAKAEAALAVAASGLGQLTEARAACDRALAAAREVDYPAGACFAHQARVVTEVRAGDSESAARAYAELVAGVGVLTTYGHLCVVPAWFLGDREEVHRWSAGVEWIGADDLETRLRAFREP